MKNIWTVLVSYRAWPARVLLWGLLILILTFDLKMWPRVTFALLILYSIVSENSCYLIWHCPILIIIFGRNVW